MKGRQSQIEWGLRESRGSSRADQMKRPTTTVSNYDKQPIIGRKVDANKLMNWLKDKTQPLVMSVTGDEGIGKTALVRSVYDLPETKHLFHFRAWVSIFNGLSLERILRELIKQSPVKELKDLDLKEEDSLGDLLRKSLMKFRYLIVLDDWMDFGLDINRLLRHFPNVSIGSRVILTSTDVVYSLAPEPWSSHLEVEKLDEESSSKLLSTNYQIDGTEIRDEVLSQCDGSPMKLLLWRGLVVAADAGSSVAKWLNVLKWDPTIQAVMHLSYRKLSHWVKPCLLYLSLFPRGSEISTRRVFQLWYAEGLARRNSPTTAEACLQELLNRNVVQLVTRRQADGSPKTCCLQGCWHEYLLEMATGFGLLDSNGGDKYISRRPSPITASPWHARCWGDSMSLPPQDTKTALRIRSYVSFKTHKSGKQSREVKLLLKPLEGIRDCALLRVLDLEGVYKPKLPEQFGDLLPNLRYLGLRWTILNLLPKSVAKLFNLETLDLKHTEVTTLPGSILSLKYLRHLYLNEVSFDNYIPSENLGSNVETLWGLSVSGRSQMLKALRKYKGLRKLGLTCHSAYVREATVNISTLTMLESLRLRSRDLLGQPANLELGHHMKGLRSLSKLYLVGRLDGFRASLDCLPENLQIVTLSMSELRDDSMSFLGQLRHLVILRLLGWSYIDQTITCPGSSFRSLRELRLWKLEQLREIRMEKGSMSSLEELEIRSCKEVREIHGLEHASKLKHIKLTAVKTQFAQHLESSYPTLIVTSRELDSSGSEPSTPEAGFLGWLVAEDFDMTRQFSHIE